MVCTEAQDSANLENVAGQEKQQIYIVVSAGNFFSKG